MTFWSTVLSLILFLSAPLSLASTDPIESPLPESHSVVTAVDRDDAHRVSEWLEEGHSPLVRVKTRLKERLLDRSMVRGSERVFGVILRHLKEQKRGVRFSDARGTPLLLSLSNLAVPGNRLTPKYERMISLLIQAYPEMLQERDRAYVGDGRLPIHGAAAVGNVDLVRLFLAHGADVNSKNASGETPLHLAARFGHLKVVRLLVSKGALVNERTRYTRATPLMYSAEMGRDATIRFLMLSGAIKNTQDTFGKTAPQRFREYNMASRGREIKKHRVR